MSLKINRSSSKTNTTLKKNKQSCSSEPGFFTKLLGISSSEEVKSNETDGVQEISSLADVITVSDKKELDNLIAQLDEAGKLFSEKPVYGNLIRYKNLLQNFFAVIIKSSYSVEEKLGKKSMVNQKIYYVIDKVNRELEELSIQVLANQTDNINLIEKLDEIRGLLVDLYK